MGTQPLEHASIAGRDADGFAAISAFDSVAAQFDQRFGAWKSVEAQRDAVREYLLRVIPHGARALELGGGTGLDAIFMARNGRRVLLTDGAPAMVRIATGKVREHGLENEIAVRQVPIEGLEALADAESPFDGAYSNFAAFNCVADLASAARGLARLLQPRAPLVLVVFGRHCVGEWILHLARGDAGTAFRRRTRTPLVTRINGHEFAIRYWSVGEIQTAFAPHFRLAAVRGIGIAVPPSAAEPGISAHPRLLRAMRAFDRLASRPLALLADHVLLHLERVDA